MEIYIIVSVAIGAIVSLIAPVLIKPWLASKQVVDIPNGRSSHSTPTLRGGGLAMVSGFLVAMVLFAIGATGKDDLFGVFAVGIAAILMAVLGFCEDRFGVPIKQRFLVQLFVGVACATVLVWYFDGNVWLMPVLVFGFMAFVNAANFMDGINGISGLQGFVIGAGHAVVGYHTGIDWLLFVGLIVGSVSLAFLPWNFSRQGLFLGDVGSYFLGGVIASTTIAIVAMGAPLATAVAPVAIYFADTGFTLVRRILKREKWYAPHRTHVYQRLTDIGWSHAAVSLIVAGFSAVSTAIGLLVVTSGLSSLLAFLLISTIAVLYIVTPRLFNFAKSKEELS